MVVNSMKDSFKNSISKIVDNTKALIDRTEKNIKFESNKSNIIKALYRPLIDKKLEEKNSLSQELKKLKEEHNRVKNQIRKIEEEMTLYNKKINALIKFQHFALEKKL